MAAPDGLHHARSAERGNSSFFTPPPPTLALNADHFVRLTADVSRGPNREDAFRRIQRWVDPDASSTHKARGWMAKRQGQSLTTENGGVFASLGKLVRRQIQFKKLQKDTVTYCKRSRPSFSTEIEFLKSVPEKKQLQDRNISKTAKWRKSGAPLTQNVYQLWLRLHSPNIVWIPQVAVLSVERGDKSSLISRGAIFTAIRQDPSPSKVVQIIGTIFTCSMLFM